MLLTSYPQDRGSLDLFECTKIWEACRATAAASTFFDPITIGPSKQSFSDSATGANNPIRHLWNEAKDIWSQEERLENNIGCIVSIGTGVPSVKKFGQDVIEVFNTIKAIATETENTARIVHREHSDLDDIRQYFRFNVPDSLAEIGLDEVSESSTIVDATEHYLAGEVVYKQIRICAKSLGERQCLDDFS